MKRCFLKSTLLIFQMVLVLLVACKHMNADDSEMLNREDNLVSSGSQQEDIAECEQGLTGNEDSTETPKMSLHEIRSKVYELERKRIDLKVWLHMECHNEYDEEISPISNFDGRNWFNWRALTGETYGTLEDIRNALSETFSSILVEEWYAYWCVDQLGFKANKEDTNWDYFLFCPFKEFYDRLYVRDDIFFDFTENIDIEYGMDSLFVKEEVDNRIIVLKKRYDTSYDEAIEIVFENNRWVIDKYWYLVMN